MTAVGAVMDPFSCGIVDSMFFDRPDDLRCQIDVGIMVICESLEMKL